MAFEAHLILREVEEWLSRPVVLAELAMPLLRPCRTTLRRRRHGMVECKDEIVATTHLQRPGGSDCKGRKMWKDWCCSASSLGPNEYGCSSPTRSRGGTWDLSQNGYGEEEEEKEEEEEEG